MNLISQESKRTYYEWLHTHHCSNIGKKPIEIYAFIDPLCFDCWSLEPILKKLQLEYGNLISIKHVLSGKLSFFQTCKKTPYSQVHSKFSRNTTYKFTKHDYIIQQNEANIPYNACIAIKAAELQGRKRGTQYLRKLREFYFLKKKDISNMSVLLECARKANIDIEEFLQDITSHTAAKLFQNDKHLTSEMGVQEIPSLVFFNENIEEEGIKVSGTHPYQVYMSIMSEIMPTLPSPEPLPNIETFMRFYSVASTKEIAFIYNLNETAVESKMKKLLIRGVVTTLNIENVSAWKYIQSSNDEEQC